MITHYHTFSWTSPAAGKVPTVLSRFKLRTPPPLPASSRPRAASASSTISAATSPPRTPGPRPSDGRPPLVAIVLPRPLYSDPPAVVNTTILIIEGVAGVIPIKEPHESKASGLSTVFVFRDENLVYFAKFVENSLHISLYSSVSQSVHLQS